MRYLDDNNEDRPPFPSLPFSLSFSRMKQLKHVKISQVSEKVERLRNFKGIERKSYNPSLPPAALYVYEILPSL